MARYLVERKKGREGKVKDSLQSAKVFSVFHRMAEERRVVGEQVEVDLDSCFDTLKGETCHTYLMH